MAIYRNLIFSIVCLLGTLEMVAAPAVASIEISLETQAQLYHSQDRVHLGAAVNEAISHARESILILTFSLSDPEIIKTLSQKVEEGVKVTVVIDRDHLGEIQKVPGIELITRFTGEGHLHHKILVVDKKEIWIGSANFTTSAYVSQENLMLRFVSPELALYLHHETDVFRGIAYRTTHGPLPIHLGQHDLFFCLLPHDGFPPKKIEKAINDQSKQFLIERIQQAKSTIKIAMMVWTNNDLAKAVIDAKRRGVHVQVVAPDLGGNLPSLIAAGVEVRVNPTLSFMHNKLMCIDDTVLVNGSANWSQSSFTRNDESFVVIDVMTPEQASTFAEYWGYLLGNL